MQSNNAKQQDPLNGRRISDVLSTLANGITSPTITIGELRDAMSGSIYGIFLLVLALPNLIPILVMGLSAILGLPLLLLTFQLMLGLKTPWFPQAILKRSIKTEHLRHVCLRVLPHLKKLERFTLPRWMWIVKPPMNRVIGLLCFILSLLIMLPIPFSNVLPAIAISFFAISILQRDGIFAIVGAIIGLIGASVVATSIGAVLLVLQKGLGL